MAKKNRTSSKPTSNHTVEVGKAAPAFTLKDQADRTHSLRDYRGKWTVLYFYPKDNTSGCTDESCQFRDTLQKFKRSSAVVLGISPDSQVSHQKFINQFKLPFDLLADEKKQMLEKYGVWQEKSMYGRKYMGIMRTTYLIDPDGKVAHRWDKVKVSGHAEDVLGKIKQLKTSRG